MVQSRATTVEDYLAELPDDRRDDIEEVRDVILANLPDGYEEGMQYGMIGYYIPLERYPETYNGEPLGYIALANQKRHMAVYLMGVYGTSEDEFRAKYEATGKRLDMGKSCVRFRRLDDLPLDLIGEEVSRLTPDEFTTVYEDARAGATRKVR